MSRHRHFASGFDEYDDGADDYDEDEGYAKPKAAPKAKLKKGAKAPPPPPKAAFKSKKEKLAEKAAAAAKAAKAAKASTAAAPAAAAAAAEAPAAAAAPPAAPPSTAAAAGGWGALADDGSQPMDGGVSTVTLGHVDAGKSTLLGQMLHQADAVSARALEKLRVEAAAINKASFYLAWAADEGSDERARGVTVDVARKELTTPSGRRLSVFDAPGHRDFVPAAISGAALADAAVLVVSAQPGELEAGLSPGGQSREHLVVVRGLGIRELVVVINKLDQAPPGTANADAATNAAADDGPFAQARFDKVKATLSPVLKAAGFRPRHMTWVPVSGLTGENVKARAAGGPLAAWYVKEAPVLRCPAALLLPCCCPAPAAAATLAPLLPAPLLPTPPLPLLLLLTHSRLSGTRAPRSSRPSTRCPTRPKSPRRPPRPSGTRRCGCG